HASPPVAAPGWDLYLWPPVVADPDRDSVLENRRERAGRSIDHIQSATLRAGCRPVRHRDPGTSGSRATAGGSVMKKSNFALRLQPSLMEEAKKVAKAEGVAVNQLINVAVAEKVSALRTEEYFAERAARGDLKKALQVLKRAGKGNPPLPGDELPAKIPRRRR